MLYPTACGIKSELQMSFLHHQPAVLLSPLQLTILGSHNTSQFHRSGLIHCMPHPRTPVSLSALSSLSSNTLGSMKSSTMLSGKKRWSFPLYYSSYVAASLLQHFRNKLLGSRRTETSYLAISSTVSSAELCRTCTQKLFVE